ncbi:hypothetical protein [Chitinibacter sp. S2-10]|uniref:hypothetical protein n=1 Tax=Chitinibacter sp. S2-10 TaxID=3373597 RepID=UPI0039775292
MPDNMEKRILVIDNDASRFESLSSVLRDLGVLQQARIAEALSLAANFKPHIVLLSTDTAADFELCRELTMAQADCRVVVLTQDDQIAHRDAAYAAGADDFIADPLHFAGFRYQIERLCKVVGDSEQLKQSLKDATDIAMMAISNSGEMGGVIEFMKRTSDCHDVDALLTALVSSCAGHFQLKVSAQIRTETEQKTLNSEGRSSPLESEMLLRLTEGARIYQYGHRLVINYPKVILQIKDLNWENSDYIGRIRDHLAIMVEAAAHRVDGIVLEQKMAAQSRKIRESLVTIGEVLQQFDAEYKYQQSASRELFEGLRIQFSSSLTRFGLTDAQEDDLLYMIEASSKYADKLYEDGFSLNQKFAGVTAVLNDLVVEDAHLDSLRPSELDDSVILF